VHDDGNDSALGVSLVDDEDVVDERLHGQSEATSERFQTEQAELAENACELMRLAQNNPRINNILNELFTLMDDDDDDCVMTCDADDTSQCSHDALSSTSHDGDTLPHKLS